MEVSGKDLAQKILDKLSLEIAEKNLKPELAIILASLDPAPKMYTSRKMKTAEEIGIKTVLFEFLEDQNIECLEKIKELNNDKNVSGILVQQPMYKDWDFESYIQEVDSKKDVDGFKKDSPFKEATAIGVWEMLSEFARLEGFENTEEFLKNKKIVVLGKGLTAGLDHARAPRLHESAF